MAHCRVTCGAVVVTRLLTAPPLRTLLDESVKYHILTTHHLLAFLLNNRVIHHSGRYGEKNIITAGMRCFLVCFSLSCKDKKSTGVKTDIKDVMFFLLFVWLFNKSHDKALSSMLNSLNILILNRNITGPPICNSISLAPYHIFEPRFFILFFSHHIASHPLFFLVILDSTILR